jgi:hypothetical protein
LKGAPNQEALIFFNAGRGKNRHTKSCTGKNKKINEGSLKNKLPILKVESPAPARRENAGISGICQKFHNEAGQDESASKMKSYFFVGPKCGENNEICKRY